MQGRKAYHENKLVSKQTRRKRKARKLFVRYCYDLKRRFFRHFSIPKLTNFTQMYSSIAGVAKTDRIKSIETV